MAEVRSESERVYYSPISHRRRALWASARQLEHTVSVQPVLKHRLNAFTNAAEHGSDTGGRIDEELPSSSSSSSRHDCDTDAHSMSVIRRSARPTVCSMSSAFVAFERYNDVRLGAFSVSVKFVSVLSGRDPTAFTGCG